MGAHPVLNPGFETSLPRPRGKHESGRFCFASSNSSKFRVQQGTRLGAHEPYRRVWTGVVACVRARSPEPTLPRPPPSHSLQGYLGERYKTLLAPTSSRSP